MKNLKDDNQDNDNIIVAFHIGRGGRFNNAGFKSFIGEKKIGEFANGLITEFENEISIKRDLESKGEHDGIIEDFFNMCTNHDFEQIKKVFGISQEDLGDFIYIDAGGNSTYLTQKQVDCGVGTIDLDGHYDTTYTQLLSDCDGQELGLINDANDYKSPELEQYISDNFDKI